MFKNTLNLIPNGVLIFGIRSETIMFANKEMWDMISLPESDTYESLKERLASFVYHSLKKETNDQT